MTIEDELPFVLDVFTGITVKIRKMFSGISLFDVPSEHRLLLLTFSALIANFVSCVSMLTERRFLSIPLVLRPVLEACADIENLSNNNNYSARLEYNAANQRLKYLSELSLSNNVPASVIADRDRFVSIVNSYRNSGVKLVKQREKFTLAGMKGEYDVIYHFMSGNIHNDFDLALQNNPRYYDDFITIHEQQSKVYEMLLAYLLFMHDALAMSVPTALSIVKSCDLEIFTSIESDLTTVLGRLHQLFPTGFKMEVPS